MSREIVVSILSDGTNTGAVRKAADTFKRYTISNVDHYTTTGTLDASLSLAETLSKRPTFINLIVIVTATGAHQNRTDVMMSLEALAAGGHFVVILVTGTPTEEVARWLKQTSDSPRLWSNLHLQHVNDRPDTKIETWANSVVKPLD